MPAAVGAVTPLKVTVKLSFAGHVMLMGIVQGPVPVIVPSVAVVHDPFATVTLVAVGAVHPVGT